MLKTYVFPIIRLIAIIIVSSMIGQFLGKSLAIYQNKKDTDTYVEKYIKSNHLQINRACMIQTEVGGESEMNCINFIDPASYSYDI